MNSFSLCLTNLNDQEEQLDCSHNPADLSYLCFEQRFHHSARCVNSVIDIFQVVENSFVLEESI